MENVGLRFGLQTGSYDDARSDESPLIFKVSGTNLTTLAGYFRLHSARGGAQV